MYNTDMLHTEKIFEELGLSPNEAKIYLALIETGESTVSEIAGITNIHRRNIYDTLSRLLEKGLVFQIIEKSEHTYRAVHPDKLLELLREKETLLNHVLPKLSAQYETSPPTDAALVYKGIEGYKNYMRDLIRVGEDVYFLGAKAMWFTPGIETYFLENFQKESRAKGMTYKTIFDPRVPQEIPGAVEAVGGEARILPDGFETVGVVDVFGDRIVSFTSAAVGDFGSEGKIFVVINQELADSYKKWFEFIWQHCKEI